MIQFILSELWPYVAGVSAVVAVWFFGTRSGKKSEQVKQVKNDNKGMQDAIKARKELDSMDDTSVRDAAAKRMRDNAKR